MLTFRFVVDLKARGARCCAVAHGQACCPTVLALLLPRRWPALRACSLADKDAYVFVYYGISPNLVGGKGGEPLGLGLTPHAGKLSYSIKLKFTPPLPLVVYPTGFASYATQWVCNITAQWA